MSGRAAVVERRTRETEIRLELDLDGAGRAEIATGLAFLDHMLETLALHAGIDLRMACRDRTGADDHHLVEDCGLAAGEAVDRALGDRAGVSRFGWALVPMDESLARASLDLSGRPFAAVALGLRRERLGAVSCENLPHFFCSLATAARLTLHLEVLRGENDHHRAEAAFKAFARGLRQAVSPLPPPAGTAGAAPSTAGAVPSTKGVLR